VKDIEKIASCYHPAGNKTRERVFSRKDIEILAPVGSWESLRAAVAARADAVYFGVGQLNMRAGSAAAFTADNLLEIVAVARAAKVKTRLTVNTVIYDDEMEQMRTLIDRARAEGVDAVIVSDQAAMLYAHSTGVEVHLSTQLNISNFETVKFYAQWADVMVLARELTLEQVQTIHDGIVREKICGPHGEPVRIEMFVHGALCMAVSGRCYLSLHDSGHSANRGACRQLCRRSWLLRDRETGDEIAAESHYLLSPKDLCTIGFLDRMLAAGVRVMKIEGRARSAEYVRRTVECYDEAVHAVVAGEFSPERAAGWTARLAEVFNRGFWDGYYLGAPVVELSKRYGSSATRTKVYVGKVTNYFKRIGVAEIAVEASPLERGSEILVLGPTTGVLGGSADEVFVSERPAEVAPQGGLCSVKMPLVRRGDKLYKIVTAQ